MQKFKNKIALVIATKDRPQELRRLLRSLESQSYFPDQVVIVDGSAQSVEGALEEFSSLHIDYLRCLPPSAAKQRNDGIKAVHPEMTLIGFLDDDTVLESKALEAMMDFWERAAEDVGGAAFNIVNRPQLYASWLKSLPLTEKLGLYSKNGGKVLPSGFHTMIGYVPETTFVQWLPTTATVWRKGIFDEFQFDEWFKGYSYLEDLDFSYRVGKKYRLAVVSDGKYYHHPALVGRENNFIFGKKEVLNRIYFVKKNPELSLFKCYVGLIIRIFITFIFFLKERKFGYFERLGGNFFAFFTGIKGPKTSGD